MKATPRTALVVVVAALLLAVSAGTGATAALMITGKQIKDGTVSTKDVKNRSLKVKDLSARAQAKLRGRTGPAGPAGATGPAGSIGLPGLSGFEVVTTTLPIPSGITTATAPVSASCPTGKKALAATAGFETPVGNLVSQVTRVDHTTFQAVGVPVPLVGAVLANTLTLDVSCAAVAG